MNTIKHGNEGSYQHQHRMKHTIHFVEKNLRHADSILDIGDPGNIGRALAQKYSCEYIYTVGDLDSLEWKPVKGDSFDVVFCFEVLEHLLNPLLFLRELKKYLRPGAKVFISTPHRPCILQDKENHHWKEMSWIDIAYLFERAEYEDIRSKGERLRKHPLAYLKGIRPLIRLFLDIDGLHLITPIEK